MSQTMRRSMKEWGEIVNAQKASGDSAKKFCEDNSIGLASFYKWRGCFQQSIQQENEPPLTNGFVEVGAMVAPSISDSGSAFKACLEFGKLKLTIERR